MLIFYWVVLCFADVLLGDGLVWRCYTVLKFYWGGAMLCRCFTGWCYAVLMFSYAMVWCGVVMLC